MKYLNLLVAYPYFKDDVLRELQSTRDGRNVRVLVDSGAFTAWKAGTKIDLDAYCRFLESLGDLAWRYFTLDVIGDPAATQKNYETMLARGFKPIPIFTRGESPSVLEDFYKTSDVVGIGGLVGTRGNRGFVKGIMEKVKNRRVHWLGFSGIPFIHVYKPYMCDSSSWASSLLYASVTLIGPRLKETRLTKKHFENLPPREVFNLLAWYGEDIAKLRQKSEWKNSATGKYVLERIAMKAGVRRCIDIESIYGTKFFSCCRAFFANTTYDGSLRLLACCRSALSPALVGF